LKNVEVLGVGCPSCKKTEKLIRKIFDHNGWKEGENYTLTKVQDISEISSRGILSTPGVIIDGTIVSTGKIPKVPEIESWMV